MKKMIVFGAFALALGLVSCKKDFICDCHGHEGGASELPESSKIREYESVKKDEAKEMCEAREIHLNEDHDYGEVHCEIK